MKYFAIALLSLSLPAMAADAPKKDQTSDAKKAALEKVQKQTSGKCDANVKLPHFN